MNHERAMTRYGSPLPPQALSWKVFEEALETAATFTKIAFDIGEKCVGAMIDVKKLVRLVLPYAMTLSLHPPETTIDRRFCPSRSGSREWQYKEEALTSVFF